MGKSTFSEERTTIVKTKGGTSTTTETIRGSSNSNSSKSGKK